MTPPLFPRAVRGLAVVAAAAALLAGTAGDAQAQSAARKLGRGLAGMTCGFLELPGHIVAETRRNGPGYGMTLGFAKGLGAIVVRELVGVYEFVTAPIEAPRGFAPLIEPEFPWDHFEDRSARTRRSR